MPSPIAGALPRCSRMNQRIKNSRSFVSRCRNGYAGNVSRAATGRDLKDAFTAFGEVSSASIIKDKFSGESRGFGFVEMPNKEEADKAISGFNGKDLKGRPLTVNEARPRTGGGGGGRGGFGGIDRDVL